MEAPPLLQQALSPSRSAPKPAVPSGSPPHSAASRDLNPRLVRSPVAVWWLLAHHLMSLAPLAAHAQDAALVYDVIAGHDPADATTWTGTRPSATTEKADLEGLRIGIPEEFLDEAVDSRVLESVSTAIKTLEEGGAITKVIPKGALPSMHHSIPVYYLVACSEASSNLARFDGMHFGPTSESKDTLDLLARYCATRRRPLRARGSAPDRTLEPLRSRQATRMLGTKNRSACAVSFSMSSPPCLVTTTYWQAQHRRSVPSKLGSAARTPTRCISATC